MKLNRPKFFKISIIIVVIIVFQISCNTIMPLEPNPNTVLDPPLDGLTNEQLVKFMEGSEEFDEVYTKETGLGPIFVASSCSSCHSGDNRGHPFTTLTRFGQSDTTSGNTFMAKGGPQLQHNYVVGYTGEEIPTGAASTKLIAPIVAGNGYIELVPESDLIALSDPTDKNNDGISGRVSWNTIPSWVTPFNNAIKTNTNRYICRFGKKASTYNLHQQCVQAFNQDIGVTTTFMSQNPYNYLSGTQSNNTTDPDIKDSELNATVFYIQTLKEPLRRGENNADVIQGSKLFTQLNCNDCHVEKLKTGFSYINTLSLKEFYPYTDLLLHDMGPELNDGYTEGTALPAEWRTAPLWGLGLSQNAQGGNYFLMHDGRAKSIEEAIMIHGGEATNSKNKFVQLSSNDKQKLISFLKSL